MFRTAVLILLLTLGGAHYAAAQPVIFIVRHAERADAGTPAASSMTEDPDLSPAGRSRATALAAMLRNAEVRAIYTSETKRARQTAAPLVTAVGIKLMTIPAEDVAGLLQKVKAETGNVLIVGHSNTIPKILEALGVTATVAIDENEYDNLFVVMPGAQPKLLRLRFP